ncbi:ferric reductase-like transmembrane domain-containing protein [Thioclava atlantica]|uniref:Ferric reductase n=1 Tax=Thioclava atlantica TaxID=1317124 RepID=A0A085U001_9RHOB|nr:ferredoxin reductase family protein [Thioclava atlantica]KFE36298.1 ferric reductase [Thioclava atlantica]
MAKTSRKPRGLPSPLLALIYLLLSAGPMLLAYATGASHARWFVQIAAGTGMVAGAMILLQMVSSGRFEAISGRIGIDVTMAFHKWAAPVALILALAHVVFLIGPPDAERPGRIYRRIEFFLTGGNLWDARIALILLVILVLLALFRDRLPVRYEIWRASHGLSALGLVGTMVWHILDEGGWGLAGWLWLLFAIAVTVPALSVYARRLTRPAQQGWRVAEIGKVAERLWKLDLAPPPDAPLSFEPGQFAWIAFGARSLPLQDHPFSIASAPGEPRLTLLIQEVGDFTRRIGSVAPGTPVSLDAPHGSFVPRREGPLLLIAGGVGIAPILSILRDAAQNGSGREIRFAYAARSAEAMVPPEMYEPACARLGITPMLISDRAGEGEAFRKGPLTEAYLAELLDGLDPAACEVMICGPGPMMTFAADTLMGLGVPMGRIEYERFSYSAKCMCRKDRRRLFAYAGLWAALLALIAGYGFV